MFFFIGNVKEPLLGIDFLTKHRLLVDPANNKLIDPATKRSVIGSPYHAESIVANIPAMGPFATLWAEFPQVTSDTPALSTAKRPTVRHHIELKPNVQPSCAKPRRLFGEKLEAAKKQIRQLVKDGILRPSNSSWASPIHMVRKVKWGLEDVR